MTTKVKTGIKYYRQCLNPNLSKKSTEDEIKEAFDKRMNNLNGASKEVIEKAFTVLDFEAKCKRLGTPYNTMQIKPQRDLFAISMPNNPNKNCKIAKNSFKPFMCSSFIRPILAKYIPHDCLLDFCNDIEGDNCCPEFNLHQFEIIPNAIFSMNKPGTNLEYIIGAASQYDCIFNVDIDMSSANNNNVLQAQYYMKIYKASSCDKAVGCSQRTDIISFAPQFKTKINDGIIMVMKVKKGINIGHGFCNLIPDPKTKATKIKKDKFHSMIWIHESNINEIEISFYKKKNMNVSINKIKAGLKTKRLNQDFDGVLLQYDINNDTENDAKTQFNDQQIQRNEYKCNQDNNTQNNLNNHYNNNCDMPPQLMQQQQQMPQQLMRWCTDNGFQSYYYILCTQCQIGSPDDFKDLTDDDLDNIAEKHLGLKFAKKNRFIAAIKNYNYTNGYHQIQQPQHPQYIVNNYYTHMHQPQSDQNYNDECQPFGVPYRPASCDPIFTGDFSDLDSIGNCNIYGGYHNNGYHSETQRYDPRMHR